MLITCVTYTVHVHAQMPYSTASSLAVLQPDLVSVIVHGDSAAFAQGEIDMRHCAIWHPLLLASAAA